MGRGNRLALASERVDLEELCKIVETEYVLHGRKTVAHLRLHLKHLRERLGNPRAVEITTDRLRRVGADMMAEGYAAASVNLHLAALQRAFSLAVQARRLHPEAAPHFPYLTLRNARQGFFEPAELEAILQHLAPEHHALFRVAYITGWRLASELLTRQWRHVDFAGGWLRLDPEEAKTRDGRQFPLIEPLRALLQAQRARTEEAERRLGVVIPWVFWHGRGKRWASVQHLWEVARAAAGLAHRLIHDFRRTAVRNMERAGWPRSAAMRAVGHKTESIYRRYAIVDEAMLREGGAKLEEFIATNAPKPLRVVGFRAAENSS